MLSSKREDRFLQYRRRVYSTLMDSNKALDQVGRWGYYQKRLFVVLVLTTLPDGLTSLHFRFTNLVPRHRCLLSEAVEKDLAKVSIDGVWVLLYT